MQRFIFLQPISVFLFSFSYFHTTSKIVGFKGHENLLKYFEVAVIVFISLYYVGFITYFWTLGNDALRILAFIGEALLFIFAILLLVTSVWKIHKFGQ